MVAAAFLFSLMTLFVKLTGQRVPSQQIVLIRTVFTLVFSYLALRWARITLWGNDRLWLFLRGLAGFGALCCVYYAVTHLPLAEATVIQYTNPVFTALLAALFLRERLGLWEVGGTFLSLSGVVLIARPAFLFGSAAPGLDLLAVGVALFGAFLSGIAYVIVRKLRATEHPLVVVFYFPFVSLFGALPTALPSAIWPTPAEWLMMIVGVSLTAQVAQVFMTRGLHLERAGRATAFSYLQIVFAACWGFLFFGEVPDAWSIGGAVLVVGGTLLTARHRTEVSLAAPAVGSRHA